MKRHLCTWIGRLNIVNMLILPKAICRFNAILVKIAMVCFAKTEKSIQNFRWNIKGPDSQHSLFFFFQLSQLLFWHQYYKTFSCYGLRTPILRE